jgi:ribonuclease P protein component
VNRRFRLTRSTDFKRVRRFGKSYAHPLVVLVIMPNASGEVNVGVSASRSVGKAVQRNRSKRLLREAIRPLLTQINPGWELILLSRSATSKATSQDIQAALVNLLHRAQIMKVENGS